MFNSWFWNTISFLGLRARKNAPLLKRKCMVHFPVRNTKILKICQFHRAIFFVFYNISQRNFAIVKIFTPHGNIFYRYNFTHASPILCSKSLHLHLYFLGSHLYIYKWFYIFYFLFSGLSNTTFFISIHCANNTRPYHTIIFHTTNFI
jgi:hypothetical protein